MGAISKTAAVYPPVGQDMEVVHKRRYRVFRNLQDVLRAMRNF
jgi:hypothetical protein